MSSIIERLYKSFFVIILILSKFELETLGSYLNHFQKQLTDVP